MSADTTTAADPNATDLVAVTTVPVAALGQPLVDFLASHGIMAFVADDDTHLDASRIVEVRVPAKDAPRAASLIADFWAENEGKRDAM